MHPNDLPEWLSLIAAVIDFERLICWAWSRRRLFRSPETKSAPAGGAGALQETVLCGSPGRASGLAPPIVAVAEAGSPIDLERAARGLIDLA